MHKTMRQMIVLGMTAGMLLIVGCDRGSRTQDATLPAVSVPQDAAKYLDAAHGPSGKGWSSLVPAEGLQGWKSFPADRAVSWKVVDGVLVNAPEGHQGVNIYTEQRFDDFELYYEYLLPAGSNSGVFLRGIYELQIVDDRDHPADQPPKDWGNGGFWGKAAPAVNASKPAGEWQSIYIKMVGKAATVVLNGQTIHDNYELPGPTHIYGEVENLAEGQPGPLILQGDHGAVQFRHVMIRPLPIE